MQRKTDEAISQLKILLSIDPQDAEAHYCLGVLYAQQNLFDESIYECKRALEIDPRKAKAHYTLAVTYFYLNRFDLSWQYLSNAQQLNYEINPEFLANLKTASHK